MLAKLVIAADFVGALCIQTAFFARADWMLGDLAYHRGVAYTVQGGMLQGEGPFAGLISYYGGLYSILLGVGSSVVGRTFDALLSAVSWPAVLLVPLLALILARRLWPGDWTAAAILVTVFTWAAPLSTVWGDLWVESVMPSASSFWPMYPRDVALALLIAALAAVTLERRTIRIMAVGLLIALIASLHAQLAVLLVWFLTVWTVVSAVRERSTERLIDLVLMGVVAASVSAWWWFPRLQAFVASGGLLIADYPGRLPFQPGLVEATIALGGTPILAAGAAFLAVRRRDLEPATTLFAVWLLAFIPLVIVSRLLPEMDLFTERRIWLVSSIGFIGLAAVFLVYVARRLPTWALPLVFVAILIPWAPATRATVNRVESAVAEAWDAGDAGMNRNLDPGLWRGTMAQLNDEVRARGGTTVVTYDAYAGWSWSFSGAQVVSLWLPGPFKLGFDPAPITGIGYLERVAMLDDAFAHGRDGICALAYEVDARSLLLESHGGQIALYDRTAASPYRVDPSERDLDSIDRQISPRIHYVDLNGQDRLRMSAGGTEGFDWRAGDIERLGLLVVPRVAGEGPLLEVEVDDTARQVDVGGLGGSRWVYLDVDGLEDGFSVTALREMDLLRVIGLVSADEVDLSRPDGPITLPVDGLCKG